MRSGAKRKQTPFECVCFWEMFLGMIGIRGVGSMWLLDNRDGETIPLPFILD